MDVVKALQHPDAATVCLAGNPAKHLDVLLQLRTREFLRLRILWQAQQRTERVAVPQEQCIRAVVDKQIQITRPEGPVVEEGKILRSIRVIVFSPFIGNLGFLHAERDSPQLESRMVFIVELCGKRMRFTDTFREFQRTVKYARGVAPGDQDAAATAMQPKRFAGTRAKPGQFFV